MSTSQNRARSATVEIHWRPDGDYRLCCTACPWMQIERSRRGATRAAKFHAEEYGHTVELHRRQYKLVKPPPEHPDTRRLRAHADPLAS